MAGVDGRSATGIYLNGATIMTTRTARHIEVARAAGFDGVEVRAERLLDAPDEVREAAAIVEPGEVWSLNGIQLQLGPDGRLDRERLEAELPPRLEICRTLGASYLLVVPPRAPGAERAPSVAAMRDGLARIRDAAAVVGAGTAFEFLGFGDCPIDTPELAAEVVSSVPGVELVLDSCHWHASGAGSLDGFPVDRLAMVHLNDAPAKASARDRGCGSRAAGRRRDPSRRAGGGPHRTRLPWTVESRDVQSRVLGGRPDGDRDDRPASPRRPA